MEADVIVIGGGTVGSAIAYGLARRNQRVTVLDGDDRDFRAARANFGLIWVQGKGSNMPEYYLWSRQSSEQWEGFSKALEDISGQDLHYEQRGGLVFCLGNEEVEARHRALKKLHNLIGGRDSDWEMVGRSELERLMPRVALGPDVSGASLGLRDGHANPLFLLSALQVAIQKLGGTLVGSTIVQKITPRNGGFEVETEADTYFADRIVIAAGLGSQVLGEQVGLSVPLRPQRGQILVTERLTPVLPLPCSGLRQTREGTVMIGATHEDVGFDVATTTAAAAQLSARAIRVLPALGNVKLVRQWAGLRVLSPDNCPVYAQSESHHRGTDHSARHWCAGKARALPRMDPPWHPDGRRGPNSSQKCGASAGKASVACGQRTLNAALHDATPEGRRKDRWLSRHDSTGAIDLRLASPSGRSSGHGRSA